MHSTWPMTFKTFFLVFLPLAAILAVLGLGGGQQLRKNSVDRIRLHESNIVDMEKRLFDEAMSSYLSDVAALAEWTRNEVVGREDSWSTFRRLDRFYQVFAEHRRMYDQVRYLDRTGRERVRVDWNQAMGALPTPEGSLQNKFDRPYFIQGVAQRDNAYVSTFDLNIEQGVVERPFKPVFRITYPVLGTNGENAGLVVLNALGGQILEQMDKAGVNASGPIYMVNEGGHWLKGPDPTEEWKFVFSDLESATMDQDYPEAWTRILERGNGQIMTDKALFTFAVLDPASPDLAIRTGGIRVLPEERWFVVSIVPLSELVPAWWRSLQIALVVLTLCGALFSWLLARARARRVQAANLLEASERQLKSITHTVLDPIIMIDTKGRAVFWNHAAETVFGYKAEEVLGRNIHDLVATEEDQKASTAGLERFATSGTGPIIGGQREVEALRKNGEKFFAELNINAIRVENQWWAVGVIRDITEKKRAEAELMALNDELEDRVETRTRDLEKALASIERRERITELLKDVASTANSAGTVAEALSTALSLVAGYTGWPVGHAYVYVEQEDLLRPSGLWYVTDEKRFRSFMDITGKTRFQPGVGLPGRVLVSRRSHWIEDVTHADDHIRAGMLDETTVRSAFGLPVVAADNVVAVLEFYTDVVESPDEVVLKMAEEVGHHLGHVVERKRIEAEVSKLALVAEKTLNGVVITDNKGRVEWINEAFSRISGYTLEELAGREPGHLLQGPETDSDTVKEISKAVREGRGIKTEILNYNKAGEIYWQEIDIQPILDDVGEVRQFIAIQNDITERIRANEALVQFKTTLDQTHDAVFIFDPQTLRFTYVNQGALSQVGYTEEEMLRLTPVDIKPDFTTETFNTVIEPLLRGDERSLTFETVHQHKDGRRIPVEILLQFITQENMEPRFVAVVRDITEQNRIKRELEMARDDAEAATLAKSEFLANMSHEIRTPMNAVIGLTHILLDTELSPKQRDQLSKILLAANSLLGLINDILDFSKIEADRLELENKPFNLDDVLDNLAAVVRDKAEDKGLDLLFDVDADVPRMLVGDQLRLGQVLINLAGNAIKFTEEGHVRVRVETADKDAVCTQIRFMVQDSGIGIAASKQAELFEPFMQSDASTTRKYGGTGLGLTICRRLVDLMGGELQVESELGKGSTFFFTARLSCQPGDCVPYIPLGELLGKRVLVVDNKEAYRPIFGRMLVQYGFEPEFASSHGLGKRMLEEALAVDPYLLLLLGLDEPDSDGFALRDTLFADPRFEELKVLTVTAFPSRFRHEGEERSPDIIKPFSQSTLFDRILDVLGKGAACRGGILRDASSHKKRLRTLSGTRVLVVEDNALNQEVATELLQAVGISVRVASDGAGALIAVDEEDFDLVFMDVQMPVMDGLEATRRIRERFDEKKLPIIAMTAHAMAGDREKSLEAGMNDHLTKPIDPQLMYGVLVRWLGKEGEVELAVGEVEASEFDGMDGVESEQGLARVAGSAEAYRRVLDLFVSNQNQAMEKVAKALERGDRDAARREAHSLKGVSGNLGAMDLYKEAEALELALAGEQEDVEREVAATARELDRVLGSIGAFLARDAGGGGGSKSGALGAEEVLEALEALAVLLEESNADAVHYAQTLNTKIDVPQLHERMPMILRTLQAYDFEAALEHVHEALKILKNALE